MLGAPLASADEQPATVTGVLFDDQNRNGVRDAGEPGLAGLTVHGNTDVVTDAEGRYTLMDVPRDSGTYSVWLPVAAKGGELTLSKPSDATGVGWISGWVDVEIGTDPVVAHDFGYGRWGADQGVSLTFADQAGHDPSHVLVGDKIRLTATIVTGDAPGYGGVLVTVPTGMHVVRRELSPGTAYDWLDSRHVRIYGLRNQDPNSVRNYPVDAVADKPTTGTISVAVTHDEGTDTNPRNNKVDTAVVVKAKPVVAAAVHNSGAGTPQADVTPALANTGVEPKPYLVAGVALLGVGVALVGAARRRPRLTDVSSS